MLLLPAEGSHRTEDLPIIQQQLAAVATAAAVAGGGGGQPLQRQPRRVLCLVPEESVTEDDLQAKEGRGFGQWQRLMTIAKGSDLFRLETKLLGDGGGAEGAVLLTKERQRSKVVYEVLMWVPGL